MSGLHKYLLLLLMLILPLQGVAAVYVPMHRALDAQTAALMPCHDSQAPHHADPSSTTDHTPAGGHDSDASSHLCCHYVFTGASTSVLGSAAHKFSEVSRFIFPLVTLFIPDSPDRPPRG